MLASGGGRRHGAGVGRGERGAARDVLSGHTGGVRGVALSADGRRLASGGADGTVRVWDARERACLRVLTGHTAGIWDVALSGDGRWWSARRGWHGAGLGRGERASACAS